MLFREIIVVYCDNHTITWVGCQRHASAILPLGRRPGTHFIGGWVGPRAGLNRCVKSRPPLRFDPQPVASRYTD
jgi:hypothetical protein